MDLPCLEWTKHVEQKWTRLGSAKRESFSVLDEIDEIFRCGQSRVTQDDLEVLLSISERYPVGKCAKSAVKFREQGNLSFKVRDYRSAALYYSEGVSYAEHNTEQLSLCYANRSAALSHLGLYKECHEDIQRALDEGYPSHLRCKLTNRQIQCEDELKKQEQSKASHVKHYKPRAEKLDDGNTQLSDAVSVHFTPEKGRHLLVAESKSAGDVVLEDEAFCSVLIPSDAQHIKANGFGTEHLHCHHCLLQTLSSVPCPECSYARYCGPACRREAWRQYHRWECPSGSQLLAVGVVAQLALRVALKAGLKEVQRAREGHSSPVTRAPKGHSSPVTRAPKVSCDNSQAGNSESGSCGGSHLLESSLPEQSEEVIPASRCSECSDHSSCPHGRLYMNIYSLLPHVLQHPPSLRFLLAFTMATLCQRMKDTGPLPETWSCDEEEGGCEGHWGPEQSMLGAVALRHAMQLRCNAQAVTAVRVKEDAGEAVQSSREVRIATAVFSTLSLLNHSCHPNTSISFTLGAPGSFGSGVAVTVRAVKDVGTGQELLHCYGPHCSRMAVGERQRLLLEQYFFHCRCEACELDDATETQPSTFNELKCERCGSSLQTDADTGVCSQSTCYYQITNAEMQRKMQVLQQHLGRALDLLENNRTGEALQVLQEAGRQADGFLMKTHPLQGEVSDATARVYSSAGDWRRAAWHLKRSLAAVRSQYGEDSVELGQQLFKLTQLHFNGGDGQAALSVIPFARRLLALHCGLRCEELVELEVMEACLRGAQ